MSSCDDEWMLKKSNATYFLRIGEFSKKLCWEPGKYLDSRDFTIGNAKFKLRFFPSGSLGSDPAMMTTKESNNNQVAVANFKCVSVYLYNQSTFDLMLDHLNISLGPKTLQLSEQYLRSRAGVGWSCFMSHAEVAGGAVLRNHKLEVRAEVAVLWERHVEDESGFDTRLLMLELRAAVRELGREVAQLRASTAQQPCRRCSDTTVRLAEQADYRNSCQVRPRTPDI